MTCQELIDLIDDYICGELVVAQCESIQVHISGCPNCTIRVETVRCTIRLARALPKCDHPLSAACEERLRKALEPHLKK